MTLRNNSKGFTLVELMLSMAFVGILLLAISVTSMHIMNTYTKGLTIRELNQSGRAISDDIQRTIAMSAPFIVSPAKTGDATDLSESRYVTLPGGGRLCTGLFTYAWNYGNTSEISGATQTRVYNTFENSSDIIRLIKVDDAGGALCTDINRRIERSKAKDLLVAGDRNLAVQKMTIELGTRDDASGQALYAISLILGTNDHSQLDASSSRCLPPSEGSGYEAFCAVNQFNIIARAGNRSGSI